MSLLSDFKQFLLRGNVIDLAVGMVVGTAFTAMVKSLVSDVIMPPIGLLLGNVDFSNLFITLKEGDKLPAPYATLSAAQEAGAVTINIGLFINTVVSLIIVGFAIFMVVKAIMKLQKANEAEEAAAEPTEKLCNYCQTSIPIQAVRCPHCTSQLPENPK